MEREVRRELGRGLRRAANELAANVVCVPRGQEPIVRAQRVLATRRD